MPPPVQCHAPTEKAAEQHHPRSERVDLMGALASTPREDEQVFDLNVHIAGDSPQC
jgi:hypothetical protein